MAEFTDRIKLIVDVTADKAGKGISDIKSQVGQAEGAFGKMKAAGSSAFDSLAQNAGLGMAGIATAVGSFAAKSIGEFQDLALNANKFGDAVGLSVEDASRWMEVAGDVGVNVGTLEGAVNKLNIAAAGGALKELGIGGDTTNERLLNALKHIQGIDDATERAKQGMKLFGKSWTELSPLVEEAGDLEAALAGVSDAKVISEEEVAKAKRFRDSMDELNGVFEDFKLTIGGDLIGTVAQAAEVLNDVKESVDGLIDAIPGLDGGLMGIATGPLRNVTEGFATLTDSSSSLGDRARGLGQTIAGAIPGPFGTWAGNILDVDDKQEELEAATKSAAAAAQEQAKAAEEAATALEGLLTAQLAQFNSQLALSQAADKTTDSFAKYKTNVDTATQSNFGNAEANAKVKSSMDDAEGSALKQAAAADALAKKNAELSGATYGAADSASVQAGVLRTLAGTLDANDPLRKNLLAYATELEKIPPKKNTDITADTSDAEAKIDALNNKILAIVRQTFHIPIKADTSVSSASAPSTAGAGPRTSRAIPGELVGPPMALPRAAAPAPIINVNVQVAPLTHPAEVGRQVANYLDAFYRRNGTRVRAVP